MDGRINKNADISPNVKCNTRDCLSRKTLTAYEMYPTSILKPSVIYLLYFDVEMSIFHSQHEYRKFSSCSNGLSAVTSY